MLGTWKVDHVQLKSILESWETKQPRKTSTKKVSKEISSQRNQKSEKNKKK
jgi:hypothetical protein